MHLTACVAGREEDTDSGKHFVGFVGAAVMKTVKTIKPRFIYARTLVVADIYVYDRYEVEELIRVGDREILTVIQVGES
jgi:hypothetical protein